MKGKLIHQIIFKDRKEIYFVANKRQFCKDHNVTERLLSYSKDSNTSPRHQMWHKGYKLIQSFIAYPINWEQDTKNQYMFTTLDTQENLWVNATVITNCPNIDLMEGYTVVSYENDGYVTDCASYDENNVYTDWDDSRNMFTDDESDVRDMFAVDTEDTEHELAKAYKKIQDLTDKLRIARKSNRLDYRKDNVEQYFQDEVVKLLMENKVNKNLHKTPLAYERENNNGVQHLIVQLSDLHIGKVVDLPNNKFNYQVARERLTNYYLKIADIINSEDARNVTVVFTGDIFNLDSHMDSLLTNEDNRANNFVQGLDLIQEFLENIWTHVATLDVIGVLGNESRVRTHEYNSNVDRIANNNLDSLLFAILKRTLPDDIGFLNHCNGLNEVFAIENHNLAICHGDKLRKHTDEEINKFKLRMYETYGIMVDYVMFGHIHSTMITSHWGRSGSLVGTDHYYSNGLNGVGGVPSQNVYYVYEKSIEGREIKL